MRKKTLSSVGSVRTADALLSAGIDINQEAFREHSWKATPLWYAVSRGQNLQLARHLLQRGCDLNHCLWAAAHKNDIETIKLLLEYGADLDPIAEDETPSLARRRAVILARRKCYSSGAQRELSRQPRDDRRFTTC